MKNGIYHVKFSSAQGHSGEGLAVVKDGSVNGGDPGYIYFGSLTAAGSALQGRLEIKRWNLAVPSVFGPLPAFVLDLAGNSNGDTFSVAGGVEGQAAMKITITGRFLSATA